MNNTLAHRCHLLHTYMQHLWTCMCVSSPTKRMDVNLTICYYVLHAIKHKMCPCNWRNLTLLTGKHKCWLLGHLWPNCTCPIHSGVNAWCMHIYTIPLGPVACTCVSQLPKLRWVDHSIQKSLQNTPKAYKL